MTSLTFELRSVTRAVVIANGEVPTLGWTSPELANDRITDAVLHTDFLAEAPTAESGTAISPIVAQRSFMLRGEPQEIVVHSATDELSVTLPAIGDPA